MTIEYGLSAEDRTSKKANFSEPRIIFLVIMVIPGVGQHGKDAGSNSI